MPAHSEDYPWPSHYGHFRFFEDRMTQHSKVRLVKKESDSVYHLDLHDGRPLRIFICECYSYGLAEYVETISNIGKVDAIVINSNWCGYTDDLKLQCRADSVGLFDIRDLMAALNQNSFWMYLNERDQKRYGEKGLL